MNPGQNSVGYLPTAGVRQVTEHGETHPNKFAGEVGFKPVTTINHDNKSVYVKAVQNMHARPVSPAVIGPNGKVFVRGERIIELSTSLHSQLNAKVNTAVSNLAPQAKTVLPRQKYITAADLKVVHSEPVKSAAPISAPQPQTQVPNPTAPRLPVSQAATTLPRPNQTPIAIQTPVPTQNAVAKPPVVAQTNNDNLKNQLEQINKILFEQIRQKVAAEIARQEKEAKTAQQQTVVSPIPQEAAAKMVSAPIRTVQPPTAATQPQAEGQKAIQNLKPTTETSSSATQSPTVVPASTENSQKSINAKDYRSQIERLEAEIKYLNKEITDLDKTVDRIKNEKSVVEISALEHEIEVDQKMLGAITDWRASLHNLINSHTLALKYLKERNDKLERVNNHSAKHENLHRQSIQTTPETSTLEKPARMEEMPVISQKTTATLDTRQEQMIALQNQTTPKSNVPVVNKEQLALPDATAVESMVQEALKTQTAKPDANAVNTMVQEALKDKTAKPDANAVETIVHEALKEETAKPDEKAVDTMVQEALKTQTAKPDANAVNTMVQEALKQQLPSAVKEVQPKAVEKEVQTPSFEAVRDLVKQALEKEKGQNAKTDSTEIDNMVRQALKEQLPAAVKDNQPTSAPTQTVYVKEVDKATVIPENALTGMLIKEQTTGPINITMSSADIEKQILDAALKEEGAKESVRQAKEVAAKKVIDEHKEKERAVETAKTTPVVNQTTQVVISPELLKTEFDRLKTSLTTLDNTHLASMNKEQRTDMIRKLQNLESQTTITKQYDEIKAAAERRRINNELSTMLHQLGEKAPEPIKPTQTPTQKIETLKTETVRQTTPAQKAHLIAEIKELERQSQARKAAEQSRPTVKAQPAFGKMLPNTPTVPNVINGIVKDAKGLLLSTVVIIVKDQEGEPVRAFKTNKIGQFALSTPVPNGTYKLELEKEGYEFDIIEVDVNGTIMQPIEIKAR